jgi:adenosylmethionine-8-amino-7-oxononanoate aminotransferase
MEGKMEVIPQNLNKVEESYFGSLAKNEFLYDENGKEYIDAISSWWISIHGHNNSYIIDSIKKQLDQLDQVLLAGYTNKPAKDLAHKLLSFTENNFFSVFDYFVFLIGVDS